MKVKFNKRFCGTGKYRSHETTKTDIKEKNRWNFRLHKKFCIKFIRETILEKGLRKSVFTSKGKC